MHQLIQYLSYWLNAVNAHSLQSPFIYDLYTNTIRSKSQHEETSQIEVLRNKLISSNLWIDVESYGASSRVANGRKRPVNKIAKHGINPLKTNLLLWRLINYFDLKTIVELGTAFGINTLHLSQNKNTSITSFEGCNNTADIAQSNFDSLNRKNIKLVRGNLDDTLRAFCDITRKVDFVFFDANHRYSPTVNYFELLSKRTHDKTIFVFDDIHWSKEMTKAWKEIHQSPMVTLSIDLYQLGIIMFMPTLPKQHYTITF